MAEYILNIRSQNKTIGFVPTMGALHRGHISLLDIASQLTDIVVCSIFVNPTQFTNARDLEKYPRPIEHDISLLKASHCDVLFLPSEAEMYSLNEKWHIDLGYLETILEGQFRPGHYQGVTQIVKKLIDVVSPDYMFMGQKDFQQVVVLDYMIKKINLPVEVVMCPIIREPDGLAMSSRNIHLTEIGRKVAANLSIALKATQDNFELMDIQSLILHAQKHLAGIDNLKPEYFEICDAKTLIPTKNKDPESIIALVAVKVGSIRLIDTIILK